MCKPKVLCRQPKGWDEGAWSHGAAHSTALHLYALPASACNTLPLAAGRAPAHGHVAQGWQSHHGPSRSPRRAAGPSAFGHLLPDVWHQTFNLIYTGDQHSQAMASAEGCPVGALLGGYLEIRQFEREGQGCPIPLLLSSGSCWAGGSWGTAPTPQPLPRCIDLRARAAHGELHDSLFFLILSSCLSPAFSCVSFSPCLPLPPLGFVAARQPGFPLQPFALIRGRSN